MTMTSGAKRTNRRFFLAALLLGVTACETSGPLGVYDGRVQFVLSSAPELAPSAEAAQPAEPADSAGGSSEMQLMNCHSLATLERETSSELLIEVIGMFVQEAAEHVTALGNACELVDLESIVAEAHAIKSSAGTFGAERLQDIAGRVETLGRQDNCGEAIALFGELAATAECTLNIYAERYATDSE